MDYLRAVSYTHLVRILLLPVPGIGTHLLDAVLSLPAKLLFCFVAFGVAGCDITVTARFDFVFQRMAACFLECVDHIEYAVAFAGSEVVNGNALVVSQFLDGFYMAACQVNNMDVIADTSSCLLYTSWNSPHFTEVPPTSIPNT